MNIEVCTINGHFSAMFTVGAEMTVGELKSLMEDEDLQSATQADGADQLRCFRELVCQAVAEWGSYRLLLNKPGVEQLVLNDEDLLGECDGSKFVMVPPQSESEAKPILITIPVGNNPARVRLLIYLKGLEEEIEMRMPADYGGLDSEEYRAINPQGKLPALLLPDGTTLFESRVIAGYIADRWSSTLPSLMPPTALARAKAELIVSVHDIYIASPNSSNPSVTATQGCMYKSVDLIDAPTRAAKVAEIAKQLDVLEDLVVGPYCVGEILTQADIALYPTFIFFTDILPRVFGWCGLDGRPKLTAWFGKMEELPAARKVRGEMTTAIEAWAQNDRFGPIIEQIKATTDLKWAFP